MQIDSAVKEMNDRKERENNIIIFNVPEPKTLLKSERLSKDTENVKLLIKSAWIHI